MAFVAPSHPERPSSGGQGHAELVSAMESGRYTKPVRISVIDQLPCSHTWRISLEPGEHTSPTIRRSLRSNRGSPQCVHEVHSVSLWDHTFVYSYGSCMTLVQYNHASSDFVSDFTSPSSGRYNKSSTTISAIARLEVRPGLSIPIRVTIGAVPGSPLPTFPENVSG